MLSSATTVVFLSLASRIVTVNDVVVADVVTYSKSVVNLPQVLVDAHDVFEDVSRDPLLHELEVFSIYMYRIYGVYSSMRTHI